MLGIILYFTAILAELIFAIGFSIFTISLIYSSLKGSPYVPTRKKEIDFILDELKLSPNQNFLELGCGDGRVSRRAARLFQVNAVGIDVNPFLIWYARFLAKIKGIKKAQFITQNIFETDLNKADVVYLFLMPKLIDSLTPKLDKELKSNSIVISHGFRVSKWDDRLFKKIERKPFPTYFYRKN